MDSRSAKPLPGTTRDPLYPDSDGKRMGETDYDIGAIIWLRAALLRFFADRPDVYVTCSLVLYYEEGNPRAVRAPDVLVAFGVPKLPERRSFFTWRERVVPQVLFEMSSESSVESKNGAPVTARDDACARTGPA